MNNSIYITKEQFKKLKEELEYLKNVIRQQVAERLKNAIELGDISENAEYDIAMAEKENLERKISEIENVLKTAKIIKETKIKDRIFPGKTFEVIEKNTNKTLTFMLVGFGESNPMEGKISTESPLGQAFLNKKVGDEVSVLTPKGNMIYIIKKIF